MGCSLTILEIEELENSLRDTDRVRLNRQSDLSAFKKLEKTRIGNPRTFMSFLGEKRDNKVFNVKLTTETKKDSIYVNDGRPRVIDSGYQKIKEFRCWISNNQTELYVFAPKQLAKTFVKRLEKENWTSTSEVHFEFEKITELENLISARGMWEDSEGAVRKVAKFGEDIDQEISKEKFTATTTLYIDYRYRSLTTQIVLSEDGRISTNEDLSNQELYEIYEEVSSTL
ncbi:hypothetical protein [Candidatus Nanohalococcus occultus]|uniref:Uncharacterized protein n=1 Tax=Candidatus Nanohalococcus occultus TaxID=2978047 RepID=A0ABY8CCZ3_9ARCH|nr:hypothetical protein SVXNc_0015 [Candidatus Nanohaloarchaeota archaeon SVXNc]